MTARGRWFSPARGLRISCALIAAAGAVSVVGLTSASADTTTLTPDRQLYASKGTDPYMDQDLHVAITAGQPQAWSYVHFNFSSLPAGADVQAMSLKLVPNSSQTQNQNVSGGPQDLWACLLDQPIPATYDPSNPPAYDCGKLHSQAQQQPDGSWTIDIGPLYNAWQSIGDTGLALVGVPSSTGDVPPVAGVTQDTWTAGFDHTRTAGSVDYTVSKVYAPSSSTAPPPAYSGPTSVLVPPQVAPQPLTAPPPTPEPTPSASPTPAPAITPPSAPPSAPTSSAPTVSKPWVIVVLSLLGAALLMLGVATAQQLSRSGTVSLRSVGTALVGTRSRLASQLALLGIAGIISAGYTGQLVTSAGTAGGGAQAGANGTSLQSSPGGGPGAGPGSSAGAQPGSLSGGGTTGPGGSASSGPGSPGSAGGTNGSGNTSGALVPGVTPTTITIGMSYLTDTNNNNATYGAQSSANNYGDTQEQANAVVKYVNAHGGVAGRQLVIHWQPVSNAEAESNPSGYLTQVCDTYTQDYHVFAVVDFINNLQAEDCYAQNHTLLLDESPEQGDLAYYQLMSPYVLSPSAMASDREQKTKIQGLSQLGFYTSVSSDQATLKQPFRLGVLVVENPLEQNIYNKVTVPELARAGVPSNQVEAYQIREDSVQNEETDIQSAVVKFEQDGVNHVLTQGSPGGGEGGMVLFFATGAYKQQYHPLYGLGSTDAPGALSTLPEFSTQLADQLKGAVGVGFAMGNDVPDQYADPWPPKSGPEKKCMDIEQADGIPPFSNRSAAGVAMSWCDAILLLQQAGAGLQHNLTGPNLFAAARALGSAYVSDTSYGSFLGGDHYDAPAAYRLLYEDPNCSVNGSSFCFKYKSTNDYAAATMSGGEP